MIFCQLHRPKSFAASPKIALQEHFFVLKIILAVIQHLVITKEYLSEIEQVIANSGQIQV